MFKKFGYPEAVYVNRDDVPDITWVPIIIPLYTTIRSFSGKGDWQNFNRLN